MTSPNEFQYLHTVPHGVFSKRKEDGESVPCPVLYSVYRGRNIRRNVANSIIGSVPDPVPDPDPPDPHVLCLPDLDPDPLVRCMDLDPAQDPDPSINEQKSKKNLDSYCFVTSFVLFIFEK